MSEHAETDRSQCPGCGLELPTQDAPACERYNASKECWQLFGELTAYTMSKNDPRFIHTVGHNHVSMFATPERRNRSRSYGRQYHQHCVDVYGAQHSGGKTKPVTTAFSLLGLYLFVEQDYTGSQVQQAHMKLGEQDRNWPELDPPPPAGDLTVGMIVDADPGEERDQMIEDWAETVWQTWEQSHQWVRGVCVKSLYIDS